MTELFLFMHGSGWAACCLCEACLPARVALKERKKERKRTRKRKTVIITIIIIIKITPLGVITGASRPRGIPRLLSQDNSSMEAVDAKHTAFGLCKAKMTTARPKALQSAWRTTVNAVRCF